MLLMLMAVVAHGIGLVFRVAELGGRVAGLGARVAKHLFDWCCAWAWIGLVFQAAGLCRCVGYARGCGCARAWLSFPCFWDECPCRWAARPCCQSFF